MRSVSLGIAFGVLGWAGILGLVASAQTSGLETPQSANPSQPRLGIHYSTEAAGLTPVTTLDGFLPLGNGEQSLTFLEGRVLMDELPTLSGGLTLGHRLYTGTAKDRVLGFYGAWDIRNTGNTTFNQLGLGVESLSEGWEFRVNGFLPVGTERHLIASEMTGEFQFTGNNLTFAQDNVYEAAVSGVDLEVGRRLLQWNGGNLRGYGGLYYLSATGSDSVVGLRGRLNSQITPHFNASVTLQHDDLFDTRLMATIGLNLPGRLDQRVMNPVVPTLDAPVQRQNFVMVDRQMVRNNLVAVDPVTQKALFFIHVADGNSNGTYESPFNNLEQAIALADQREQPVIIYINGATAPLNGGVLPASVVQLISSGVLQTVNTQFGTVQLPDSGSGVFPEIRGTVTLPENGQNVLISGLNIDAQGNGRGITGTGLNNLVIRDNTVVNALGEGIYLADVTGQVQILDNVVRDTLSNNDPVLTELNGAILVNNSVDGLELLIENNLVESNLAIAAPYEVDGIEFSLCRAGSVSIYPGCAAPTAATVQILNNTVINRGTVAIAGADGIDTNLDTNAVASIEIRGNTIENQSDKAISFGSVGTGHILSGVIADNTITNAIDNGIHVRTREASIVDNLLITGNTVTNALYGIDARLDDDGGLLATPTGTLNLEVTDNTLSNNRLGGIRFRAEGVSTLNGLVQDNQVTGNSSTGEAGIFMRSRNDATLTTTLIGNTVTGITGDAGIVVRSNEASRLCARLEDNSSQSNTAAQDFLLRRENTSTLELFGISTAIAVASPSAALETALTAQGNSGTTGKFRVQNNPVQVPTAGCNF